VTEIAADGVGDAIYESVCAEFNDKEIVDLTMAVIAINGWNRLAITFRSAVGSYVAQ
jgi:alkylhydroperoxidase family enzyme